jgi:hypothetical protein
MLKEYNMEDRIQINGVWYVREQPNPEPEFELNMDNVIRFRGISYESDKYVFEATIIRKPGSDWEYYDCDIEFKDKRTKPWVEDLWDNITWVKGVLNNNPESLVELRKEVCPQGEAEFKAFLKVLKQEGWL